MNEEIQINTEYIQLGKFLKLVNAVESGGMVKLYLADHPVLVNGEQENRRGRKLYPEDRVELPATSEVFVVKKA
ncbi:S4 domain-containing protein YaaA [Terribacillus sp. 7520-G]|uniref:S4 domain-containing protein YaaA n=1 Tax=Terribacillus TaxID=459532 RepID=UPI000BA67295|nr:S4 domain-containing protein YaaA [Terribacillus sp. 7520-G]PAD38814.1 RNA-binding protein [Terribacillus sp. 7520-G]